METGLDKVVVGEADCCQETELCKSSDRKTMCMPESIIQGSTVLIQNSFEKIRMYQISLKVIQRNFLIAFTF